MIGRFISHRGNLRGPNPERENEPQYILEAIDAGFDVEIDVWMHQGSLYLGHDEPTYEISPDFLVDNQEKFWCHAKNNEALFYLIKNRDKFHSFSHNQDPYVLTSQGVIWAYVGMPVNKNTVCVLPEQCKDGTYEKEDLANCYGICSDEIQKYYDEIMPVKESCILS